MNKWTRPFEWSRASAGPAGPGFTPPKHHYYAFLSYSHEDNGHADWLHQELERFRVPSSLAGRLTANGVVPKRLAPIFRDRQELAAANDLNEEIREALEASRCLIVLCSPAAARSKWINKEIEAFKRAHPDGCIIAAIVAGEPFASEAPGQEQDECLPQALRQKYDKRGRSTGKRAEPLAADLREGRDGRRLGLLKIVAGMLGLSLDDLVQRDHLRRQRRLAGIAAGSLAGMFVATALAVTAVEARDEARDQRREAESLVGFMVGDLKDKLEPIGKLDALDGVGSRVLEYYGKQDASELSDRALAQRSQALSLMAEVAMLRGNTSVALRLYREALAGTSEAVRRNPDDPQRLFEHAQNVFYVGEIESLNGNSAAAEAGMREYKRLAVQMVALEPDNLRWRLESQYADYNLGAILNRERRFAEASAAFRQALGTIRALAAADPKNADYQQNVPEALAWLADTEASAGKLPEATRLYQQQIVVVRRLLSQTGNEPFYRLRLVRATRALGELYAMQGESAQAVQTLTASVDDSERLLAIESANTRSLEFAFKSRFALATVLAETGNASDSAVQADAGCKIVMGLVAREAATPAWREGLRDCWIIRTRLALQTRSPAEALALAQRAVAAAKSVATGDRAGDSFGLAQAYRLAGDAERASGNQAAAQAAWKSALSAVPTDVAERPGEMSEYATILQRNGRAADERRLRKRLAQIGYRRSPTV